LFCVVRVFFGSVAANVPQSQIARPGAAAGAGWRLDQHHQGTDMTRIALGIITAVLVCGCASESRWDTSTFPNQIVYGAASPTPVAVK
jgi:hypothetical protein